MNRNATVVSKLLPPLLGLTLLLSDNKVYLPLVSNNINFKSGYTWSCLDSEHVKTLNMSWFHRWQIEPDVINCNGVEFIQHFSCETRPFNPPFWQNQYEALQELVDIKGDQSFYLLFLNEPDLTDQCYRTPQESALIYKRVLEIAPNAIIVGVQTSHFDYLNDWVWTKAWFNEISRLGLPSPHYGSIHNYNLEPLAQLDSYFQIEGVPDQVWVTEFGSSSHQLLTQMIDVYQNDPRVFRYAYFNPVYDPSGNFYDNLLIDEKDLTQLGYIWVSKH